MDEKTWCEHITKYAIVCTDDEKVGHQLNPESIASAKHFVAMAKLGFLTGNSQEGRMEVNPEIPSDSIVLARAIGGGGADESDDEGADEGDDEGDDEDSNEDGNESWRDMLRKKFAALGGQYLPNDTGIPTMSERAYVQGMTTEKIAFLLVHFLNKTDKVAFIDGHGIPITYQHANNVWPMYKMIPREVPATTRLPVIIGEYDENSAENQLRSDYVDALQRGAPHLSLDGIVCVTCFDPRHGRAASAVDGLYPAVIAALETADAVLRSAVKVVA